MTTNHTDTAACGRNFITAGGWGAECELPLDHDGPHATQQEPPASTAAAVEAARKTVIAAMSRLVAMRSGDFSHSMDFQIAKAAARDDVEVALAAHQDAVRADERAKYEPAHSYRPACPKCHKPLLSPMSSTTHMFAAPWQCSSCDYFTMGLDVAEARLAAAEKVLEAARLADSWIAVLSETKVGVLQDVIRPYVVVSGVRGPLNATGLIGTGFDVQRALRAALAAYDALKEQA